MAQVFLVGGAVRDLLMGKTPKDFDFVVVGSTPEEMVSLGFEQVGADFPVFLHPVTGDEFALARTERKVGTGHTGFECEWEGVTLEEDLSRRDLTINAMAIPVGDLKLRTTLPLNFDGKNVKVGIPDIDFFIKKGKLIDPFNGQQDIKDKRLTHVSNAFLEDPLRILRIGRFLARFGEGWSVNAQTMVLVQDMINQGMLLDLTPERVWKETSRALMEPRPDAFFKWLWLFDANIFPELDKLFLVPQRPDFHPEGDAGIHTLLCLKAAADMNLTLEERFAVLCHDFGKHPAHVFNSANGKSHLGGHEAMGLPLVEALCDRLKVPNDCRKLAMLVTRDHTNIHNFKKLKAATIARMFKRWDISRHPERALQIMNCCTADGRGRGSDHENDVHPSTDLLPHFVAAWLDKVDVEAIQKERATAGRPPLTGCQIGGKIDRIKHDRLVAVKQKLRPINTTTTQE